jgi:hypothetical protein
MASIRLELAHNVLIATVCSVCELDVDKALRRAGGSFDFLDHGIHQGTTDGLLI